MWRRSMFCYTHKGIHALFNHGSRCLAKDALVVKHSQDTAHRWSYYFVLNVQLYLMYIIYLLSSTKCSTHHMMARRWTLQAVSMFIFHNSIVND